MKNLHEKVMSFFLERIGVIRCHMHFVIFLTPKIRELKKKYKYYMKYDDEPKVINDIIFYQVKFKTG
jgi:hypothetical protein